MLRTPISLTTVKASPSRHFVSFWASKLFERSGIKQWFGLNLVAAVFVAGVITPEANNVLAQLSVTQVNQSTPIQAQTDTLTTIESPLATYAISQQYTFWHQGIDMTAPSGTPIYAIEAGVVELADSSFFGYGRHVIIAHERGMKSLYGHMSEITTEVGRKVARGEMIGKVGSTGWSTGDHLHLEVYQNDKTVNPFEVLPIHVKDIKWDGGVVQKVKNTQESLDETVGTEETRIVLPSPTPAMALTPAKAASPSGLVTGVTQ